MEDRQDIEDYWNECELMPSLQIEEDPDFRSCDEAEVDAELLEEMGLSQLTAAFKQGQEVALSDVDQALANFSVSQAEAVRRRVRTLNNTVRQRKAKNKSRKADVRDVFKSIEISAPRRSSGSGSGDSLDAGQYTTTVHLGEETSRRKRLDRVPSVPIQLPHPFRNYIPDVAGSDGLKLIRYQYLGTLPRGRSGSDPLFLEENEIEERPRLGSNHLSRSHGDLISSSQSFIHSSLNYAHRKSSLDETDRTWIDSLDQSDVEQLKPLVVIEATAIFDEYCTHAYKRKPIRTSRKPEGNVFGVPILTLLEKDERVMKRDDGDPYVPAVLKFLLSHLERHHLREEGLLRVSGMKMRIDDLTSKIETNFYTDPQSLQDLLYTISPHDVTAALKKFLRELPEPLLTYKLIYQFYSSKGIRYNEKQEAVLNLLVLQLPREHQATLRYLFRFLLKVVDLEKENKMGINSIATILAPSLFPPRSLTQSRDDMTAQRLIADNCIELTRKLLLAGESLWLVPRRLLVQLRNRNQKDNKRPHKLLGSKQRNHPSVGLKSDIITVDAPQFDLPQFEIRISDALTARDVVLRLIKEGMNKYEGTEREPLHRLPRGRAKPLTELTGMALSCALSTAEPETALQTHFLYEYGGNIVHRELEPGALITAVLRDNPAAKWRLECRHRNSPKRE